MKNGFTLIELLAVIVILAIIALIATPIILGIINDAREESNERSVELYASSVINAIAAHQLREGQKVTSGQYTMDLLPFEVEYDGDVACDTINIYEDGEIYVADCKVNGASVKYTYGTKQTIKLSEVCNPVTVATKGNVPQGNYIYGDEYICDVGDGVQRTFYVLENGDNTTLTKGKLGQPHYPNDKIGTTAKGEVSLIMGSNIVDDLCWETYETFIENGGSEEAWNAEVDNYGISGNNTKGPTNLVKILKSSTIYWKVDVSIPTYNQLELIDANLTFENMAWLVDEYSYWTSTSDENYIFAAYSVWDSGISSADAITWEYDGIRPVITVQKD